jgi:hypothetical protein
MTHLTAIPTFIEFLNQHSGTTTIERPLDNIGTSPRRDRLQTMSCSVRSTTQPFITSPPAG